MKILDSELGACSTGAGDVLLGNNAADGAKTSAVIEREAFKRPADDTRLAAPATGSR